MNEGVSREGIRKKQETIKISDDNLSDDLIFVKKQYEKNLTPKQLVGFIKSLSFNEQIKAKLLYNDYLREKKIIQKNKNTIKNLFKNGENINSPHIQYFLSTLTESEKEYANEVYEKLQEKSQENLKDSKLIKHSSSENTNSFNEKNEIISKKEYLSKIVQYFSKREKEKTENLKVLRKFFENGENINSPHIQYFLSTLTESEKEYANEVYEEVKIFSNIVKSIDINSDFVSDMLENLTQNEVVIFEKMYYT